MTLTRPLWRLLLEAANCEKQVTLSCEECFTVLAYLAEQGSQMEMDHQVLVEAARRHLACCPDCRAYFIQRLEEIAAQLK